MKNNFYIVLMAGGSGTRLWPMSRKDKPKQFQKFSSEKSLLQETYERIKDLVPKENIYISLTQNILQESRKQLENILKENFIVEPEAKNTAPAIGLVAAKLFKLNPDAIVATIASDHTVKKVSNYQEAILHFLNFVEKNPEYLAAVGIKPTRPDTGLGYLKLGKKIGQSNLYKVEQFVEKPDLETAQKYLASGKYLWNACYFAWHAGEMLKMFEKYETEIYEGLKNILRGLGQENEKGIIREEYKKFPKVPIDTAIAEKHDKIAVVPADMGWSDVGSWAALYEILAPKTGNHTVSQGHHIGIDDRNCLVYAQDRLLATVGLEDIIIVDMPDVTLVCNKNKSQDVKKLIDKLKEEGKSKYL